MQIIKDELFKENLQVVLKYIAQDSKTKASKFNKQLSVQVNKLDNMPFKFRQSNYYDDNNIRDLIFKGYTIPYLVDEEKELIVVLDIFKYSFRKIVK
ncbi:plasmid stabilization protein [Aliarcobacter cryaerophilus]|uniref:Plasmid stabilization protein n=1 Tax=Aliarcobacter cryaerophilus TaxID=28198 RepID=A0A2S9SZB3_9BACT|nr:type II toxin-antitoxin system RelE/ParE family toxin [Aliarcobacter cryaerophilus]PRM91943.1 plasmid stabilization protein [Aliarcobacter cryaerophilus]